MILITGCVGFIGSHLCEYLLKQGEKIIGIDNLDSYYSVKQKKENLEILKQNKNFIFYQEDILDLDFSSYVEIPFLIIHLAAKAGVRNSLEHPEQYMKINVEGTTHLLNQCVKYNIKRFIYASSSSVYGMNTKIPFKETDLITTANSPYAVSKLCCENIAKMYSQLYDIETIGLRFFTVYGPRGRPDMAPFKFLTHIMNETLFEKYGDGKTKRDYTYIDDIVQGIIATISYNFSNTNIKSEIFNLGNNNPCSLNYFIEICEKVCGKKANFIVKPIPKGDVPITYASIEKSYIFLNYHPKTDLETGLTKMYQWLLKKN